jgi:AAA domain
MPISAANQIVSQAVSWLWPERIPLGKLVLMDGDPDLGKSLLALDLCARLSTGRPFPDGQAAPGPANSLVLSAEDTAADTIVPRLERLGADMQRVFIWQREDDKEEWPWRFPGQADRLDDALSRTDARLAVIDPLMAFLDDSVLCASDQSVRRALAPLMRLAEKHQCALLMHRHLNKQGGGRALYRGLGSIAFVADSGVVGRQPHFGGRAAGRGRRPGAKPARQNGRLPHAVLGRRPADGARSLGSRPESRTFRTHSLSRQAWPGHPLPPRLHRRPTGQLLASLRPRTARGRR